MLNLTFRYEPERFSNGGRSIPRVIPRASTTSPDEPDPTGRGPLVFSDLSDVTGPDRLNAATSCSLGRGFDPHRPTDVLVCDHIMTPRGLHLNETIERRNPKSLATSSICLGLDREDPDTARRGMSLHDDDREFVEPGFRCGRNTKYRHGARSFLI